MSANGLTPPETPPEVCPAHQKVEPCGVCAKKRAADLRWLKKAENWGEWIRFSDTELAEPERVWMMRGSSGAVRFYAKGKGQVGEQHRHLMAASYWAWGNRWLHCNPDGGLDMLAQLACRAEVLAGGATPVPWAVDRG